jgi:hypothetical protein
MTPCRPRHPLSTCDTCARLSRSIPEDPEQRTRTVLIDAAAILPEGARCTLHVERPQARYWWEAPAATAQQPEAIAP